MENTLCTIEQNLKHNSRSNKYKSVSTKDIINFFQNNGFIENEELRMIENSKKYKGFQKHLIRLFHPNIGSKNERPEIILLNSHNGSTSLKLFIGVFRFICLNGLMTGQTFFNTNIRHTGQDFYIKLDDALNKIKYDFPKLNQQIIQLKNRKLSTIEIKELSKSIMSYRLKDVNVIESNYEQLLNVNRLEDSNSDAWSIFNRIQENVLQGNFQYKTEFKKDTQTIIKDHKARVIKGINKTTDLNNFMWEKTLEIAA